MIKAIYYRRNHRLTLTGHADSGEAGHDLVCASASTLAYTLASFVSGMAESGQLRARCIKLAPGDARISCRVDPNHDAAVTLAFDSICAGFGLLAHDYPDFIKFDILCC